MENKFVIESRYECWTSKGKTFCNWYVLNSTPLTEKEANGYISQSKKSFKFIDDKTKLKHEYRLKSYEEYENEIKTLYSEIKKMNKAQEKYLKSDEYKELQKKKRQAAKERKERQKKYLEEHGM